MMFAIALELPRVLAAAGVIAAYGWVCLRAWRRGSTRTIEDGEPTTEPAPDRAQPTLIVYASQTGFARELACEARAALESAGVQTRLMALGAVPERTLAHARDVLFIVSTCGEGDVPDNGAQFAERVMQATPVLAGLRYGLLALGDREYADFCGFGRRLDAWLERCGARAAFPRLELDRADAATLESWRHRLARFGGMAEVSAPAPRHGRWRLRRREVLNPGGVGLPVAHVELEPIGTTSEALRWEAGDLFEILPGEPDTSPRLYSIASLPADGAVHLLVRLVRDPCGNVGRMSGLLVEQAPPGAVFDARIRAHDHFRLGENAARPLILIGNGTGLAGLLAHLRHRARNGDGRNWLIFGERNAAHDDFHGAEIDQLIARDLLVRCDRVFSRDQRVKEYVQHRLERAADSVRDWVSGGAAVYVCGNAVGMGRAVDETLARVLGSETLARLKKEGRYRRDVY